MSTKSRARLRITLLRLISDVALTFGHHYQDDQGWHNAHAMSVCADIGWIRWTLKCQANSSLSTSVAPLLNCSVHAGKIPRHSDSEELARSETGDTLSKGHISNGCLTSIRKRGKISWSHGPMQIGAMLTLRDAHGLEIFKKLVMRQSLERHSSRSTCVAQSTSEASLMPFLQNFPTWFGFELFYLTLITWNFDVNYCLSRYVWNYQVEWRRSRTSKCQTHRYQILLRTGDGFKKSSSSTLHSFHSIKVGYYDKNNCQSTLSALSQKYWRVSSLRRIIII